MGTGQSRVSGLKKACCGVLRRLVLACCLASLCAVSAAFGMIRHSSIKHGPAAVWMAAGEGQAEDPHLYSIRLDHKDKESGAGLSLPASGAGPQQPVLRSSPDDLAEKMQYMSLRPIRPNIKNLGFGDFQKKYSSMEKALRLAPLKDGSGFNYNVKSHTLAEQLMTDMALSALEAYIQQREAEGENEYSVRSSVRIIFADMLNVLLTAMPTRRDAIEFLQYVWPGTFRAKDREVQPGVPDKGKDVYDFTLGADSTQSVNVHQNLFQIHGMRIVKTMMPVVPSQSHQRLSNEHPVTYALIQLLKTQAMRDWLLSFYLDDDRTPSQAKTQYIRSTVQPRVIKRVSALKLQPLEAAVKEYLADFAFGNISAVPSHIFHMLLRQRELLFELTKPFNPGRPSLSMIEKQLAYIQSLQSSRQSTGEADHNVTAVLTGLNQFVMDGGDKKVAAQALMTLLEIPLMVLPIAAEWNSMTQRGENTRHYINWLAGLPKAAHRSSLPYIEQALVDWSGISLLGESQVNMATQSLLKEMPESSAQSSGMPIQEGMSAQAKAEPAQEKSAGKDIAEAAGNTYLAEDGQQMFSYAMQAITVKMQQCAGEPIPEIKALSRAYCQVLTDRGIKTDWCYMDMPKQEDFKVAALKNPKAGRDSISVHKSLSRVSLQLLPALLRNAVQK